MRTYGKVKIAFWEDDKIKKLQDTPKLLALYCLTGEHSNAIGCFRLPIGYIETDLRWDKDKAQSALTELIEAGFVIYDDETNYLLMPRYLEHNPIENSRVGKMCVQLINNTMRSHKIFPALWRALQHQKNRFSIKDDNFWNPEWDALYKKLCVGDYTVSAKDIGKQHTLSDTVSDTLSHTVSDTVSPKSEVTIKDGGNPQQYTVSDTLSDTVGGSVQDFAPPEPEPQPKPKPENRDDEVTRPRTTPVEIIRAFDEAIVEVFGEQLARPWPHGEDAMIAAQFIAAGADRELCRQVFLKQLHSHHRKGKHPIGSLAYFRTAIPDAVKDRTFYQQNPITEVNHDGTKIDASRQYAPRARSGHDAFTEALVEVVHERERD